MHRDEHKITGIEDCKATKRLEKLNKKSWATVIDQDLHTELKKLSQAYQILMLVTLVLFVFNPKVTKSFIAPFNQLNDLIAIIFCICVVNLVYKTDGIGCALVVAIIVYKFPVASILFFLLGVLSFIRKMRKQRVKIDFMGNFNVQVVGRKDA